MIDFPYFKQKLTEEKSHLEKELASLGRRVPNDNTDDWEATPGDLDILSADRNDVADKFEEFEERSEVLNELEIQYNEVKHALMRITDGSYGQCENDGHEIPLARLKAFPSARTCIEHTKQN